MNLTNNVVDDKSPGDTITASDFNAVKNAFVQPDTSFEWSWAGQTSGFSLAAGAEKIIVDQIIKIAPGKVLYVQQYRVRLANSNGRVVFTGVSGSSKTSGSANEEEIAVPGYGIYDNGAGGSTVTTRVQIALHNNHGSVTQILGAVPDSVWARFLIAS